MTPKEFNILIGKRVQALRLQKRMSVTDLAFRSGLFMQTVHNVESGAGCATYSLCLIANAMEVSVLELLSLEEVPQYQ